MPQPTNWSGKDCKGTPPMCGHNHHTPPNHRWGETWHVELLTDFLAMDGETLEEHIKALLAALGDPDEDTSE